MPDDAPDSSTPDIGTKAVVDAMNPTPDTADLPSGRPSVPEPQAVIPPSPSVSAPATPSRTMQSPVSIIDTPKDMVRPAKRGGLAGVMDEIADSIAGTQGSARIFKDAQGNEYIEHPTLSRKQQWIKIAGEALHGAAAGAAAKPGPGQLGRAAEAGVEAGDEMVDRANAADQQTRQNVRNDNQDLFNQLKLKMDMAGKEFELQRMGVQATQSDVKFSQEQTDRMMRLVNDGKAFDLGTYKDEADLARVKQANPNFWKDFHANGIVGIPQMAEDGKRTGIRIFQTTPGVGNDFTERGTPFKVFTPPAKPGEEPSLQDQIPTVPMTWNQKHAYDLAAWNQMQKYQMDQATLNKKEGSPLDEEVKKSNIAKNNAEANAANARATKDKEKVGGESGYLERPDSTVWIGTRGEAEQNGYPFEQMKPGDINKDKQAMRQLNDVQLNASRYTRAAQIYANPQTTLTYRGKPIGPDNPIHPQTVGDIVGLHKDVVSAGDARGSDNENLNTLMNKAGWAELNASLSGAGGHVNVPVLTAFGETLSREIGSRAYNDLTDQAKDLYDGYLRTLSAVPAYIKVLTTIGRSNKEILNLELANIKHPGYSPNDILRGQEAFQQNIDKAADGFPRNMVGVPHVSDIRRQIENNGGNPELPPDVKRLMLSPMGK